MSNIMNEGAAFVPRNELDFCFLHGLKLVFSHLELKKKYLPLPKAAEDVRKMFNLGDNITCLQETLDDFHLGTTYTTWDGKTITRSATEIAIMEFNLPFEYF